MYLKDVLKGVRFKAEAGPAGLKFRNLAINSKAAAEGDLFIAIKGYSVDGHKFIDEAIKRGARIIITEEDFVSPRGVTKILVKDARAALPVIAGNFYRHPSKKLKIVGITGTNGKTTITYLLESILKRSGEKAGVIGTINYRINDKKISAKNTTPGPLELQGLLAEFAEEGASYAVMEVSSHSLDQDRVAGITFDAGIITNVTKEHLDYHKTIRNYLGAKAKLLGKIKKGGIAILNNDDARAAGLRKYAKTKVLTYGIDKAAGVRAINVKLSLGGTSFTMVTPKYSAGIETKLIGKHNVSNILAAAAAAFACGVQREYIKDGIKSFSSVPGRLEPVDEGQPFKVFVDFAHTEDALFNVLGILRKVARRRIITIFGCGGNRDRTKRPLMGRVACELSDDVVITSDNPRFEEPRDIIDEIETGVRGRFSNYRVVPDRREAIEKALAIASKDDIIIIAGKGHEKYQIVKEKTFPFDDCEVARSILRKVYNKA